MPDTVTSLKLKRIHHEIDHYSQQYERISEQILRTLNEADKIPLREHLAQIERDIARLEEERTQLESDDPPLKQPEERKPTASPNKRGVPWLRLLSVLTLLGITLGLAWLQPWKYFPFSEPTPTVTPAATPTPTTAPEPTATPTETPEPTATPTPAAPQAGEVWNEPTTGMEFVYVLGGCFQMGQTDIEKAQLIAEDGEENYNKWFANELPRHEVCVHQDSGFWMGKYEVTNAQYRGFKADHDSRDYEGKSFNGDDQPVVHVSWNETIAFTEWLTKNSGGTAAFRLSAEAEWEYAARAGMETIRYWGNDLKHTQACQYENVSDQTLKKAFSYSYFTWQEHDCNDGYAVTAPVGTFKPNKFGLYDMLGNVYEWCQDTYASYSEMPTDGSTYGSSGDERKNIVRGGSWDGRPNYVRSSFRHGAVPDDHFYTVGFRVVVVR